MELFRTLHFVLYPALALLAWAVARKDRGHRLIALFVTWMVASDWARLGLRAIIATGRKPYAGLPRLAVHLSQLLVLSWSFLFVALCLHYFLRRSPAAAWGGWAVTWLACLNYPLVSGEVLDWLHRLVWLGCLGASWACILWAVLRGATLEPSLAHLILILYAATDAATYLVPLLGDFVGNWPLVNLSNVMLLLGAGVAHAVWLARNRRGDAQTARC